MARKIKGSETLQGYYQTKSEATRAAKKAQSLGMGAKVVKVDWGRKKYAVYMWLKK